MEEVAARYAREGRGCLATNCRSAVSRLAEYLDGRDVEPADLDGDWIDGFAAFLVGKGLMESTVRCYLRMLRLMLRQADGMPEGWADGLFSGVDLTARRQADGGVSDALPDEEMRRLADAEVQPGSALELWRDLFLFSFYMRGMELADVAYLTPEAVHDDGTLRFRRRRKGAEQCLRIGPRAMAIIRKYADASRRFIFPVFRGEGDADYNSMRQSCARSLRKLGRLADCPRLSFGMAKATWLRLADENNPAERGSF